jgi:hypothetical protein
MEHVASSSPHPPPGLRRSPSFASRRRHRRHRIIDPNFSAPLSCKVVRLQNHGRFVAAKTGKEERKGKTRQGKAGSFDANAGGKSLVAKRTQAKGG